MPFKNEYHRSLGWKLREELWNSAASTEQQKIGPNSHSPFYETLEINQRLATSLNKTQQQSDKSASTDPKEQVNLNERSWNLWAHVCWSYPLLPSPAGAGKLERLKHKQTRSSLGTSLTRPPSFPQGTELFQLPPIFFLSSKMICPKINKAFSQPASSEKIFPHR